jgi:ABC-type multidrug transport system fused ATPase/permease subunit
MGFLVERWRTRHPKPAKTLVCMCYATVHGLMAIYVPKYLVDELISRGPLDKQRFMVMVLLAAGYAVSALLFWKLDYKHVDLRGRSGTRKDFRNWILQKYLWFTENTHTNSVNQTRVVNAMVNQVEDLVSKGWYAHFQFIAAAFDVVCSVILVCWLNWKGILPLAFLIPAISIVVQCRKHTWGRRLRRRGYADTGRRPQHTPWPRMAAECAPVPSPPL